jgi:hypothetical protein
MIPAFDENGNLPPGAHEASWEEFVDRFGRSAHRRRLIGGMKAALLSFKIAGCKRVFVDGSFVTEKSFPNDYDACWDEDGVDPLKLDPVLLRFENRRAAQKAKYLGEFFPSQSHAITSRRTFIQFFQTDKNTGDQKGIVVLDLLRLRI